MLSQSTICIIQHLWNSLDQSSRTHFDNRTLSSACESEQGALRLLGHTPATWDNLSGDEQQPWSSIKHWVHLTESEKAAAVVLGYTAVTWDNKSGAEPQPASANKEWSALSACPNGLFVSVFPPLYNDDVFTTVAARVTGMHSCTGRSGQFTQFTASTHCYD